MRKIKAILVDCSNIDDVGRQMFRSFLMPLFQIDDIHELLPIVYTGTAGRSGSVRLPDTSRQMRSDFMRMLDGKSMESMPGPQESLPQAIEQLMSAMKIRMTDHPLSIVVLSQGQWVNMDSVNEIVSVLCTSRTRGRSVNPLPGRYNKALFVFFGESENAARFLSGIDLLPSLGSRQLLRAFEHLGIRYDGIPYTLLLLIYLL